MEQKYECSKARDLEKSQYLSVKLEELKQGPYGNLLVKPGEPDKKTLQPAIRRLGREVEKTGKKPTLGRILRCSNASFV